MSKSKTPSTPKKQAAPAIGKKNKEVLAAKVETTPGTDDPSYRPPEPSSLPAPPPEPSVAPGEGGPTALVKPVPIHPNLLKAHHITVPRQRGDSPLCPKCRSGMTVNRTERVNSNHPVRDGFGKLIVRYYQCKKPKCPIGRTIPFKRTTSPGRRP